MWSVSWLFVLLVNVVCPHQSGGSGDTCSYSSLCTSLFFCPHKFYVVEQSERALSESLPALCEANDCTEHLQLDVFNQHRECLRSGAEKLLGDGHKNEYVNSTVVEGFCVTEVGCLNAARFYSPSVEDLDRRILLFCEKHDLDAAFHFDPLKEYVMERCFTHQHDNLVERRVLKSSVTAAPASPHASHSNKGNSQTVLNKVMGAMRRTRSHTGSNGILMIPKYKFAICVPPKSGLVSILFVLLAILGNHPNSICGCHDHENNIHPKFGCLGMDKLRHYSHPMYDGLVYLNDLIKFSDDITCSSASGVNTSCPMNNEGERLLKKAFTDPDWHTIMVVRDPWRRAISAFHEDNGYQGWLNLSSSEGKSDVLKRRTEILEYLAQSVKYNHAMPASSFCNLKQGLKYDHYFDIDSGLKELSRILMTTSPPVPMELLTTGWENCTEGMHGSILQARLKTSHTWIESRDAVDKIYCVRAVVQAVVQHFREDYRLILPKSGGKFPVLPPCLPSEDVLDWLMGSEI